MESVRNWIREHDDRWSFVFLYVGGAVALSIFMNLFWVMMLMAGNFLLKIYRNYLVGKPAILLTSLWQVKLDIALILFAFVIGVYSEHVFAALGLSQAARAGQAVRGLQMATRFGIIERGMKVFLMTVDDQARIVNAIVKARKKKQAGGEACIEAAAIPEPQPESGEPDYPWRARWGKGDIFTFTFGGTCATLLLLAPSLTGRETGAVIQALLAQISPFAQ